MILHAGLVALRSGGTWRGALIEGPSGAGKSDLALRAMGEGLRLVADDQVLVWASGGQLFGRAPGPLAGLIEIRGLGIDNASSLALAEIALSVECVGPTAMLERMPAPSERTIAGIAVPRFAVRALEPSAPAKLRRAILHLGGLRQQAYLSAFIAAGAAQAPGPPH